MQRILIFVCILGFPLQLIAQRVDSATTNIFKIPVDEVLNLPIEKLMDVNIEVASKLKEKLSDAPSSVTVFTRQNIRHMGITYVEELLNYVPGFQTGYDVEQGKTIRIASRGRGSALSESVLFLVNGQRLNDLYTGGVSVINRLIAVENIKQVEIIRGPGSALYGSNAFLGVVNIITTANSNDILFELGNLNAKRIAGNFSKNTKDLSFSAFVRFFTDEGYQFDHVTDIFGNTDQIQDPQQGTDASLMLRYKKLKIGGRYTERQMRDFLVFGAINNNDNRELARQTSVFASYEADFNKKMSLQLRADYSADKWETAGLGIPAGLEIAPGFSLNENFVAGPLLRSYYFNALADFGWDILPNNHLKAGISFSNTAITEVANLMTHHPITLEYQQKRVAFEDSLSFNEKIARNFTGIYLQDKHKIGNFLQITLGVRLDNYSDFGTSVNPRAAVVYTTPIRSKVKAIYGKAFRAPNFLELYDKNNPVDFGNPNLAAESIQTIEIAYIQNIKKLAQVSATYFNNNIQNLIVLDAPVTDPKNPLGAPAFINKGELTTQGLELELKSTIARNIQVMGSYTFITSKDTLPVNPHAASLAINFHLKKLNINLHGIYRSKMILMPNQADYTLLNAVIKYDFGNLGIYANIKNALNTQYYTPTSAFANGVINRGRTFQLGGTYRFK